MTMFNFFFLVTVQTPGKKSWTRAQKLIHLYGKSTGGSTSLQPPGISLVGRLGRSILDIMTENPALPGKLPQAQISQICYTYTDFAALPVWFWKFADRSPMCAYKVQIGTHKVLHGKTGSGTITPSQHVISHRLCQWAKPPKMAQVRKASQMLQLASLQNGHLGGHLQKTIDLLRNHQIWTSKSPKLNGPNFGENQNLISACT